MLTVLDLFSGIGGFSLGLERTGGFKTIAFCEIDPFCRAVLKKHWPEVPCYEDVRKTKFGLRDAHVVVGGFPCQDISVAGKRAGITGARSGLWRHLLRAIRLVLPKYAIVENVAALLDNGMGTVLGDLAKTGYDAEWDCISAMDAGLPTFRERVWIVAQPLSPRRQGFIDNLRLLGRTQKASAERRDSALRARDSLEPYLRSLQPNNGLSLTMERRRLGQFGNAVVPQIPELIGHAILQAEAGA